MMKLGPEWFRTSDPVIRRPERYRWTTAPAHKCFKRKTSRDSLFMSVMRLKHVHAMNHDRCRSQHIAFEPFNNMFTKLQTRHWHINEYSIYITIFTSKWTL